jgi:hypothetical protein
MSRHLALPLVVTATLLASCAVPMQITPKAFFQCTGAVCEAEVKVVKPSDGSCRIDFSNADQLELKMPRGQQVTIRWALDSGSAGDYEFRGSGFFLKHIYLSNPFENRHPIEHGRKFQLLNRNDDHYSYPYGLEVHARRSGLPTPCEIDPLIHNIN